MAKQRSKFMCQACGYESPKWMGKCPGCHAWNQMTEERESQVKTKSIQVGKGAKKQQPVPITLVKNGDGPRIKTHMNELNRVLGGGMVPGSLVLVGGDPGIGKSTLLLQLSHALSTLQPRPLKVLYVSGEESAVQTRIRADRLGALSDELILLCETNLDWIEEAIEEVQPDVMIVDSIQTVYHPEVTSAPGSVSQVRECTGVFMRWAKTKGIATVLVGHVTKEGALAGPRLLEHMVDCVLYFEGERHQTYRLLRAVKNRFGSTNEIGLFEMIESGLKEVTNPSELFLERRPIGVSGSAVAASMEGTRPVLVELQALVTPTHFPSPRRTSSGLDYNRLTLMMAVLEKRVGLVLYNQDAYVNAVGGVKLDEPAADLAIAVSVASGFRDVPTKPQDVFIGEVGLTGEVRHVSKLEQRIREAEKLGFKRVFIPASGLKGLKFPDKLEVIAVETVTETLKLALA